MKNVLIKTDESLVLSNLYKDRDTLSLDEILDLLENLEMENYSLKKELEDIKKLGGDYEI